MNKIGIIGITGFTGFELLKILLSHNGVAVDYVASRSNAGQAISDVYPQLSVLSNITIKDIDIELIKGLDLVFLALPHTVSMGLVKEIYPYTRIVDLSADFRLKDPDTYKQWYSKEHSAIDLLDSAVYGLCEIRKQSIKTARLVANPGCYATSMILPLAPILDYIDTKDIVVDSKSGVSGAGRGLKEGLQFCEVNEDFKAYSIASHRHTPEVEGFLSSISNKEVMITFSPHLLPIQRGILSTLYIKPKRGFTKDELIRLYSSFYKDNFFVRIKDSLPAVKDVKGSNFCDIGFEIDKRNNRIVIVSVIDNLIKGASGQAVQNMNIMLNLNENEGLTAYPYYP